ncbi:alpha/beta hydrolase [Micromonospora sp. WMMD1120]|uniref:alpha/beta hydrolase n=1 Tax=Micromonospora sp. WMMD1120 TaxID=3016106 RepID=UPI0024162E87|nr:alpha/beta hydrolase [Micromonospora sp. WMMD1120]MDG4810248.1 alpha/beta hydrolase [Micromonospora sp. WMMD1120]
MAVHPQVAAYRSARAAAGAPPLYAQTLAEARAADLAAIRAGGGPVEPVTEVRDERIPGPAGELPLRVYRPARPGPLPTLLYFFGGGWTLGGIDTADGICRRLANAVPCQVITVGYRLAPEHPFPAAVHDCHAAVTWIARHAEKWGVDPARLAVGGDSAGGNLAAAVTLLCRTGGPPLVAQLLVYPNTDQSGEPADPGGEVDPTLFNSRSVAWYRSHYLADPAHARDPLASPLLAEDLSGLPPALVVTAELDPLCAEGQRYAERLRAAGVPTRVEHYPGMIHGFFAMPGVFTDGRRAQAGAAAFLRDRFGLAAGGTAVGDG